MKELGQKREEAINAEIARLNAALGPDNAAKLKAYVTKDFSSNVTVKVYPKQPLRARPYGPTPQALGLEVQP